jgi:hypothetical protein
MVAIGSQRALTTINWLAQNENFEKRPRRRSFQVLAEKVINLTSYFCL